jgi:hypothetical protein
MKSISRMKAAITLRSPKLRNKYKSHHLKWMIQKSLEILSRKWRRKQRSKGVRPSYRRKRIL